VTGPRDCAKFNISTQVFPYCVHPMTSKSEPPLADQIPSVVSVWILAVLCGLGVFVIALGLQWLVYDDWMHNSAPLHLVGSAFTFFLTFVFVYRWQLAARRRKLETLRRFETIRWMNDRIRNSLQAIECIVYATNPHVTDPVKDSVDTIERVLEEVLTGADPAATDMVSPVRETDYARRT
jgi:hypothetical protein